MSDSVDIDSIKDFYRLDQIQSIPLTELRDLYKKVIDDLID
jgi:hypothetical protein